MANQQQYNESDIFTWAPLRHIRAKPSLYLGFISSASGVQILMKEPLDNSFDEAATVEYDNTIKVFITRLPSEGTYQVTVCDEGRGIPLGSLRDAILEPRTTGKDSAAYDASAGIFGLGVKATVAMSRYICAVTRRPEGMGLLEAQDLECTRLDFDKKAKCPDSTGTIFMYEPDPELLGDQSEYFNEALPNILRLCELTASHIPGCRVEVHETDQKLKKEDLQGSVKEVNNILSQRSVSTTHISTDPCEDTFSLFLRKNHISQDEIEVDLQAQKEYDGLTGYDVRLIYTSEKHQGIHTIGSVNRTPIEHPDSHNIMGAYNVIKEFIAPFIDDMDVREYFTRKYPLPIYGVISVARKGAVFCGQTKTDYKDREFLQEYMKDLRKRLKDQYDEEFWKTLYNRLAEHIELSFHQYYNKGVSLGSLKNVSNDLNYYSSYSPCRLTDPDRIELFIAEGDSAGGHVSQVCDKDTQAVFKLRGKLMNALQTTTARLRKDPVIQDLEIITGVRVGAPDLSTFNFRQINILTDADADGHHISALLTGLFYRMHPDLLANGHVYVITPPLYKMQAGKQSMFLRDENAMMDVKTRSVYSRALEIELDTGHEEFTKLEGEFFRGFCRAIDRVGDIIERMANHLVIDPLYLELMAHCVDCLEGDEPDTETIRKRLGYDRVDYEPLSNALTLSLSRLDITIPLTQLADTIKAYILPELEALHWRQIDIRVTTRFTDALHRQPMTVYQLYRLFRQLDSVFSVTRHKGLGEMTLNDLKISSVDPVTRTAMEITGLGDVDRLYKLLGTNTEARKNL